MGFVRRVITGALDLANLSKHNDNFADIEADLNAHDGRITTAQGDITTHKASETAHAAEHITYSGAVAEANTVKEAVDSVKTELSQAIIAGDSGPEAAAARASVSGETYPTLGDRLNAEYAGVTSQLAESSKGYKPSWSVWQEFQWRGVNVKWFGVAGDYLLADGSVNPSYTDDTAALQAAINSKLPLDFPAGTHCAITDYLSSNTGDVLIINGAGKALCSIRQLTKDKRAIYANSSKNEIRGISLYGTGQGFTAGETENGALLDVRGDTLIIENCGFHDADYLSVLVNETCYDVNITDSLFSNAWAEEIAFWGERGVISNCIFTDSQNNAIVLRGSDDVIVSDCIFTNIGQDVDAAVDIRLKHSDSSVCNRISVIDCHFTDCYLPLSSFSETTNYHNTIIVRGCTFNNPTGTSYDNWIRLQHCNDIYFDGNTLKSGGAVRALYITSCKNIRASENTFMNVANGMLLTATNLIDVYHNTFDTVTGTCISVSSPDTTYVTCKASDNTFLSVGVGIEMSGIYVGRLLANFNTFKNIGTFCIRCLYTISILETVGNTFLEGEATAVSVVSVSTWIKGKNVNFDREYGSNGLIPLYPTTGKHYYNTSNAQETVYDGTTWRVVPKVMTVPSSASASGSPGDIAYDSSYFYFCRAVNTWERVAKSTW